MVNRIIGRYDPEVYALRNNLKKEFGNFTFVDSETKKLYRNLLNNARKEKRLIT